MLAPAAAGSVLDLKSVFHQLVRFCLFIPRKVFFSSSRYSLHGSRFRFGPYGPDETQ